MASKIESTETSQRPYTPSEIEDLFEEKIVNDLLLYIFTFLGENFASASLVNRRWKSVCVQAVMTTELNPIICWASELSKMSNSDACSKMFGNIVGFINFRKSQKFTNPLLVKRFIHFTQEKILRTLVQLNLDNIAKIKEKTNIEKLPASFKNIFLIVHEYKKLEQIRIMAFDPYAISRVSKAYTESAVAFAALGRMDEASKTLKLIGFKALTDHAYFQIAQILREEEKFKQAIDYANLIDHINSKEALFNQIFAEIAVKEHTEKALEYANQCQEPYKSKYLIQIINRLANSKELKNVDEALRIATQLNKPNILESVIPTISIKYAVLGYLSKAIDVLKKMSRTKREVILHSIVTALIKEYRFADAKLIIKEMTAPGLIKIAQLELDVQIQKYTRMMNRHIRV